MAYDIATRMGLQVGLNEGFIDAQNTQEAMKEKINALVEKAYEKQKIIAIAHPKPQTLELLKQEIPKLRGKIRFITIKEYFGL